LKLKGKFNTASDLAVWGISFCACGHVRRPGRGGARATKPSFTVKAPTSVENEASWSATVSGFSGSYKNVMVAKERGVVPCPKIENTFSKKSKSVAKEHKFKLTFHELQITEPPQTFTMCTYLYSGSKYVVKTSHYQIVPNASERAKGGSEG
jgi:hypothetical protein